MKKGLVLEGGAMRGMFSCGVTDVMMENNIEFDGIIGVSAGAAFGCNYKSRQPGRALRYNTRFSRDKRYSGLHSLITTGNLFNAEFCYRTIPEKYDIFDTKAFYENPTQFIAVCTNIETGKPYYKSFDEEEEDMFEWFRASASLPLVSKIVEIGGMKLLDGGIVDSIPIKYMENIGYEKNIVVLTQPYDYEKTKNKAMPLIKAAFGKYPEFVKAVANRHNMYNETLDYIKEKEKTGELLAIRPPKALNIKRAEKNPDELRRVYEEGRKTAQENIEKILDFLK